MSERVEIEERLQAIMKRKGTLTPDAVIEDAQNPDSPLHGEFDWDVEAAAMEHWREQARRLIRSVHVEVKTETMSVVVPRYIRNPAAETKMQGYAETAKIRSSEEKSMSALMYEIERAEGVIHRIKSLAVGLGLEEEADDLLRALVGLRKRAKRAA